MKGLILGTVTSFKKQRGVGFIKPDKSHLGDKVSCHWKTIKSTEKWPTLVEGMRVAFKAAKDEKKQGGWKTTEVYNKDGKDISTKDTIILLENGEEYRGECTSWNKVKGEGLIKPHEEGPWLKKRLRVLQSDIDPDAAATFLSKGQQVQFQVTKEKSVFRAVNVILPGAAKAKKVAKAKKAEKAEVKIAKDQVKPSEKKAVKKGTQKRQFEEANKDTNGSAQKKMKVGVKKQMKRSQLVSGTYGGMEVSVEDVIEVGILLKSNWVGSLIGKKGATIKEIKKLSDASLQFGNDEIPYEGATFKVFAISGTMNQVADACKVVAVKLGEAAQTLEYKIVFLVPDAYCGMFVGKKGSTINEIRGEVDLRVRVVLSQQPLMLPGASMVTVCTVFGPRENVKDAIERTVGVLGGISAKIKKQMTEPPQMPQWDGDRFGGDRYGGYRGNFQDIGAEVGARPANVWGSSVSRGSLDWGRGSRGGARR